MTKRTRQRELGRIPLGPEGLQSFQAFQSQLADLNELYSQARVEIWQDEMFQLKSSWQDLAQEWEDILTGMEEVSGHKFDQIGIKAMAMGTTVAQSMREISSRVAEELDNLGDSFEETLNRARGAWETFWGSSYGQSEGLGSNFSALASKMMGGFSGIPDWFHQGGIVRAHQGMVISPSYLNEMTTLEPEERLVIAQTGEGILPRRSMGKLGRGNFEALRRGEFDRVDLHRLKTGATGRERPVQVHIHVNALDGGSVAGLDWDRIVRRQVAPALRRAEGRKV